MRRDRITPSDGEGRCDGPVTPSERASGQNVACQPMTNGFLVFEQMRMSDSAQALHTKDASEVIHVKIIERARSVIR
jgi:hypothetical protein